MAENDGLPSAADLDAAAADDVIYAEVDRLRAVNAQLLEALEALLDVSDFATNSRVGAIHLRAMAALRAARAEEK